MDPLKVLALPADQVDMLEAQARRIADAIKAD